ncbi:hypothetical protein [Candidatus Nitrososphaera gargensis]|nr:hypothetical protein [Candidatus Nitrososphaera gargensis]
MNVPAFFVLIEATTTPANSPLCAFIIGCDRYILGTVSAESSVVLA